eukprot:GEMP01022315.1.p1 GENE.GEMP01022315.1~~GEMP01022315.1.p1  ORF type:complete len:380 (+),score=69.31 GEMP01022315.1:107-1246(+)
MATVAAVQSGLQTISGLQPPSGLSLPWGSFGRAAPPPKVSMNFKGAGVPVWSRSCLESRGITPDKDTYFSLTAKQKKAMSLSSGGVGGVGTYGLYNGTKSHPVFKTSTSSTHSSAGSTYEGVAMETMGSPLLAPGSRGVSNVPRAVLKLTPRRVGADMRKHIEEYTYSAEGNNRRKSEKNYSDFFDHKMPRQLINEPGDMTIVNQTCAWTDTRTEVARRNFEAKHQRSLRKPPTPPNEPRIRVSAQIEQFGTDISRSRYNSEMSSRILNNDQGSHKADDATSTVFDGASVRDIPETPTSPERSASRQNLFPCGTLFTSRSHGQVVYLEPESPMRKSYVESRMQSDSGVHPSRRSSWEEARRRRLSALSSDRESLFGSHE